MLKQDLIKQLENIEDTADINETILGLEDFKPKDYDINTMDIDTFKKLLVENKEVKGFYTSEKDRTASKAINTFKENNLQKLIDEAIKAKSNEGKTPEQIQLEELTKKLEAMEREKVVATNKSNYTKTLTEKGLNADLVDFIYADDEEVFNTNLEKISNIITTQINDGVNNKLTTSSYTPPKDEGGQVLDGVTKAFLEKNPDITL